VNATYPAGVLVLCGNAAASERLETALSYRAGGGRGENAGRARTCWDRFCWLRRGKKKLDIIEINKMTNILYEYYL
jgi:hypothetical protein